MGCFKKEYNGIVRAIITEAVVLDSTVIDDKSELPKYYFTTNAAWDTGAENTIVSRKVIEKLGLKPIGRGSLMGIGGDEICYAYKVQLALPNGDIVKNLIVYYGDIDDYDILIGMDVISLLDICITNNPKTKFTFRYPSEGKLDNE